MAGPFPDNPADPFKKALAEESERSVTSTIDPSGVSGETMRLPRVTRRMARDAGLLARGVAEDCQRTFDGKLAESAALG